MGEFFASLVYVSAVGALIVLLLPSESPFEKHVRYAVGVMAAFFVIMSVSPLFSSVGSVMDAVRGFISAPALPDGTDGGPGDWIITESAANIEKSVAAAVSRKFRITDECVGVKCVLDTSDKSAVRVVKIVITLSYDGEYISRAAVGEYVSDMLMCECEVYYDTENQGG